MPNLVQENPFLQGATVAADFLRDSNETVIGTQKQYAISNFLSNLGEVRRRIDERESLRQTQHYKRLVNLMNEPSSHGGMTMDQLSAKLAEDQRRTALMEYSYEIARMADESLAQQMVDSNLHLVGMMDPREQAAMSLGQPKVSGLLSKFLAGGMNVHGRGGKGGANYQKVEASTGTGKKLGAFDPESGTYFWSDYVADPTSALKLEQAAVGLGIKQTDQAIKLEELGMKMEENRGTQVKSTDMGNSRFTKLTTQWSPSWDGLEEQERDRQIRAWAKSMGVKANEWRRVGDKLEIYHTEADSKSSATSSKLPSEEEVKGYARDRANAIGAYKQWDAMLKQEKAKDHPDPDRVAKYLKNREDARKASNQAQTKFEKGARALGWTARKGEKSAGSSPAAGAPAGESTPKYSNDQIRKGAQQNWNALSPEDKLKFGNNFSVFLQRYRERLGT